MKTVVHDVVEQMAPAVAYIRFNFGEDWSGDPAIYFRVVLSDEAAQPERLHSTARRIRELIDERMDSLDLGVFVYINVRSLSEQAAMNEPSWA